MTQPSSRTVPPARIERLHVRNFRALQNVDFRDLQPMTALLGPNGSGKSTVFDVFAFLAECFDSGLQRAWDRRGRASELMTRESSGPLTIEIEYRERRGAPPITYHFSVQEARGRPVISHEWLCWSREPNGPPFRFLENRGGEVQAVGGEAPDEAGQRIDIALNSPDLLAVNALGQFREHPRIGALRSFITGWHVSHLSADGARGLPEAGPQERLTRSGDNLANVVQHLQEQRPRQLDRILSALRRRVPRVERVLADTMLDGRLLLQVKDAPFERPVLARFASDGTLKMLAHLVLLYDPEPPPLIGIEEPEDMLHPRLLAGLAEECRAASERTQLLVATHSPFFIDSLHPNEVRVLWRDVQGHTQTRRAADLPGVPDFISEGAQLGDLWMEGHFGVGDPLTRHGDLTHAPS